MNEDDKIEYLTLQLNDTTLSEAKKFAIKKELRMIKAQQIKQDRKVSSTSQQQDYLY
jgi:hypothetical protein